MKAARHLEIMVGGCDGSEYGAIREFFELRGYQLRESRQGAVFRLWATPPVHRRFIPAPEGRGVSLSVDELRIGKSMVNAQ